MSVMMGPKQGIKLRNDYPQETCQIENLRLSGLPSAQRAKRIIISTIEECDE